MTLYPPWSSDTNDSYDINQIANVRSRKEIQDKLYKDTPVKTEINKSYIDNIDAYKRNRALITKSFGDRLGLGQYSLANNLIPVFSSSYAGCFCLVCWFSCSFVSEACACFGEWLREVLHVETFVRVLRSSRVNLK